MVELIRRLLVALKYGKTGIEYARFPFFTGNRVDLGWRQPSGLNTAEKITFTVRCVEEWLELTGLAGDRSEEIFHDQLWAATRTTTGTVACRTNRLVWLSFDIPEDVQGSCLSAGERIIFWELEVVAEAPGVDFDERYLVPIYTASA
jgi:hypothetical protein